MNVDLAHRGALPKSEFPSFDGTDPVDWMMKCEYYF